jgi:hypothetical protein
MNNHGLARNAENETICLCGYRPEIWDKPAPVGKQWKAKAMVLAHVAALTEQNTVTSLRSPQDPFHTSHERRYPRAGVRQGDAGKWIITLWDEEGVVHVWENQDNAEHHNRLDAFDFAQWFIKCHRDAGVRLNGRDVA